MGGSWLTTKHFHMGNACVVSTLLYGSETWICICRKKGDLPPSTCKIWEELGTSPGRTKYPTTKSWNVHEYKAWSHCSDSSAFDCLDIFIIWMMAEYLRKSSLVKWHKPGGQQAAHIADTEMFVSGTSRHVALMSIPGKLKHKTETLGSRNWDVG